MICDFKLEPESFFHRRAPIVRVLFSLLILLRVFRLFVFVVLPLNARALEQVAARGLRRRSCSVKQKCHVSIFQIPGRHRRLDTCSGPCVAEARSCLFGHNVMGNSPVDL